MKKSTMRLIGLTLSMFLLFSTCIGLVSLAEENKDWSDEENRDTAWTDGAISTPQQLANFAHLVNSGLYDGENEVWLTQDIDLSGHRWISIGNTGSSAKRYKGNFNGNGFTVKNLNYYDIAIENASFIGLFGVSGGNITSVNVTGKILISKGEIDVSVPKFVRIGGIAGYSKGTIINCNSDVDIDISTWIIIRF